MAYFVAGLDGASWVLRHNRRGGVLARINRDRYLWVGRERARPNRELRLLKSLRERGLPVPEPIAARIMRRTGCYRGDLIITRIPDARPLADHLVHKSLAAAAWRALGGTLARFHRAGVWHGDLNARNILLDAYGGFHLIDFDKARLRAGAAWQPANLARLRRSLDKFNHTTPGFYFTAGDWAALHSGYQATYGS